MGQEECLKTMAENGVEIILETPIKSVTSAEDSTDDNPKLTVEAGTHSISCDCILSATGRSGWTAGLGLENLEQLGLKIGRGKFVQVNHDGYTGVGKVYAVGDVAGGNLATIGEAQAMRAVRLCFGSGMAAHETGKAAKPFGVWTIPELAWAGINEQEAAKNGINYASVCVKYSQTVKGCVSQEEGVLKMICNRDNGVVLGIHIFGEKACDIINYGAEVVADGDTIFDVLQFVFPAVTYHQLYHYAAWEAKIRLRGVQNLRAATAWRRLRELITSQIGSDDAALTKAFKMFDSDNSGFLNGDELFKALLDLGLDVEWEDVKEMMLEATGDPDDTDIDYEAFLRLFVEQ